MLYSSLLHCLRTLGKVFLRKKNLNIKSLCNSPNEKQVSHKEKRYKEGQLGYKNSHRTVEDFCPNFL